MFKQKEKQKTKEELQIESTKQLAKESLGYFRNEYAQLVQKYGWIHGIRWTEPSPMSDSRPLVTEVYVKKELDKANQQKSVEESIVVKN